MISAITKTTVKSGNRNSQTHKHTAAGRRVWLRTGGGWSENCGFALGFNPTAPVVSGEVVEQEKPRGVGGVFYILIYLGKVS